MNKVHFVLQGKGGVGKSVIASLIAQFYASREQPIKCIDTDPVNATLGGYNALDVKRIDLMHEGTIDNRRFDEMMELLINEDTNFVVDNGAASFVPLSFYLVDNDALRLIAEAGKKEVMLHTVITGGQSIRDTAMGFKTLAENMPAGAKMVVWLNEFFGPIEVDGKGFEEMQVYKTHKDKVTGIIRIAKQTQDTFAKDVELMLGSKLTFAQVNESPEFGFMAKQRLSMVRRALFEQMEAAV